MVFSSHVFLFYFLPLALGIYYVLPRRGRHLALTLLSYVFYGWANPAFVLLMLASTFIDWAAGLTIAGGWGRPAAEALAPLPRGGERTTLQRRAVAASVCSNLLLLGFFKYFNFGIDSWNAVAASLGLGGLRLDTTLRVVLPLGISFYTFQSMSYAIDVYRGDAAPKRSFLDFACFVSMFPQLVAGPIIRYSEVAEQMEARSHTIVKFARGAAFVSLGLAKKILIANPCGKVADTVFGADGPGALDAWIGAVAYAFQIYFDFSAYSDMAVGLGLMLGFVFAKNFDSPYLAESITDFWRRWHLSLSTWLRDYLYVPLGGNRRGEGRTYANLALVMLIGGLWHGASWNFVVWGGLHGTFLVVERLRGGRPLYAALPRPARVAATFGLVLATWIFFRAPDLPSALAYGRAMLGLADAGPAAGLLAGLYLKPYYLGTMALAGVVAWTFPQTWSWTRTITWPRLAVVSVLLWASLAALATQAYNPFIYFIF
jgi:alginate O-acetyltransferase complex protein AlgI